MRNPLHQRVSLRSLSCRDDLLRLAGSARLGLPRGALGSLPRGPLRSNPALLLRVQGLAVRVFWMVLVPF